jgi:hypothetical protein
MTNKNGPSLTIVGGQPERSRKRLVDVPVGLEQLLFLAARDQELKADLLANRNETVERLGITLRPTEATTLRSVSDDALKSMIERIRPDNPKRRKIMRLVAAAATSLAAGTVTISCDDDRSVAAGDRPDDSVVYEEDAGEDRDSADDDTDSSRQ